MADDLAAVIGHFGLEDITLVCHSLGSKEAIRYLSRHGDARIARLVLVAPTTADVPAWCASFEAAGPVRQRP